MDHPGSIAKPIRKQRGHQNRVELSAALGASCAHVADFTGVVVIAFALRIPPLNARQHNHLRRSFFPSALQLTTAYQEWE